MKTSAKKLIWKYSVRFSLILLVSAPLLLFQNCGAGHQSQKVADSIPSMPFVMKAASPEKLMAMTSEVAHLTKLIAGASSRAFKNQLESYKRKVIDTISANVAAKTCKELFMHEPLMTSGVYKLYTEKNGTPMFALCVVENNRVVGEKIFNGPIK